MAEFLNSPKNQDLIAHLRTNTRIGQGYKILENRKLIELKVALYYYK